MEQVATCASYSVLKTTTSQLPTLLSAPNHSQTVHQLRTLALWQLTTNWKELIFIVMLSFYIKLFVKGLNCFTDNLPLVIAFIDNFITSCQVHPTKPLQGLWKLLPMTNSWLTSHLFFLLAPRQQWDQTQAPLSCNRDKMACIVLGFCIFGWISFLDSPNLLLGPVLSANPAGFISPFRCITVISHRGCLLFISQWITHPSPSEMMAYYWALV